MSGIELKFALNFADFCKQFIYEFNAKDSNLCFQIATTLPNFYAI